MNVRLSTAKLAALLFPALLLAGCTQAYESLPELPPVTANANGYVLGPGDRLEIDLFGAPGATPGLGEAAAQPGLPGSVAYQYTISETGMVGAPLVGEVKAAGLTVEDLRKSIVQKLAQSYLRDPKVGVQIVGYRPYYVLGEVNHPGSFPYAPRSTVLSAIATAGGYGYRAVTRWAIVERKTPEGVIRGKAGAETPIQPDDVITVPERYF